MFETPRCRAAPQHEEKGRSVPANSAPHHPSRNRARETSGWNRAGIVARTRFARMQFCGDGGGMSCL